MDTTDTKALSRQFYEAYDRNDRQSLVRLLAADCVVHLPGAPGPLDRATFLQISALFADAFSDSRTTFEDQIAEKDTVVTRWVWQITHTGTFQGIPPTGKRVSLLGVTINRFAHGEIVEQRIFFDQLSLVQQLGPRSP